MSRASQPWRALTGSKVIARVVVDWLKTGELRGPTEWSIGVYRGSDPFHLVDTGDNPVITRDDVTDVTAAFVADPLMIRRDGSWFMFFEVANLETRKGEIGLAVSPDGLRWRYQQIVLAQEYHLSFPFVFAHDGSVFMIPETAEINAIEIYQGVDFPLGWERVVTVAEGLPYEDPNLFHTSGRWWLMASTTVGDSVSLHLFHSESLLGNWTPHPTSMSYHGAGRPAGRVINLDGALVRPAQQSGRTYGEAVVGYVIESVTTSHFTERRLEGGPLLAASGVGWNAARMHTLDVHSFGSSEWIASVDGRGFSRGMTAWFSRVLGGRLRPYEYPRADE